MNDDEEKPTRHVEITYVAHQIRNLDEKAEQMPMSLEGMRQLAQAPGEEGNYLCFCLNIDKSIFQQNVSCIFRAHIVGLQVYQKLHERR